MEIREYLKLTERTRSMLPTNGLDNIHMVYGLISEMGELTDPFKKNMAYGKNISWVNIGEEIGDLLWYLAGLYNINGLSPNLKLIAMADQQLKIVIEESENLLSEDAFLLLKINEAISDICDVFKNSLGGYSYKNNLGNLNSLLDILLAYISEFCVRCGFDVERVMQTNIDKLKSRYPEKFDSDKAINRNLDRENEILSEIGF